VSSANPITEFLSAIERAANRQVDTAPVALATADADGRPSVRMVLLRGVDERGFVFHTNYNSRKARELAENPQAALCVHWHSLEEQIRIEGRVERLQDDESDAYFGSRPRGSQLGAWASNQSAILASRETLEEASRGRRSGAATVSCRIASSFGSAARIACTIGSSTPDPRAAGTSSVSTRNQNPGPARNPTAGVE
jgi:pyridoxamine-phosphate oxidase